MTKPPPNPWIGRAIFAAVVVIIAFVTGDKEFAAVLKSRGIDVRIASATFDEDSP